MKMCFRKALSLLLCFAIVLGMGVNVIALTVEDNYSPFDSEDTSEYTLYSSNSTGAIGNLTWSVYKNGLLEISGTGAIPTYSTTSAPWDAYCSSIKRILVRDTVTEIGASAFSGISVKSVTLPFAGKSRTASGPEATFGYIFGYETKAAYSKAGTSSQKVYISRGDNGKSVGYVESKYVSNSNCVGSSPYYNMYVADNDCTYRDLPDTAFRTVNGAYEKMRRGLTEK